MKLVRNEYLSARTLKFAYPTDEALAIVEQALRNCQDIEGLESLRSSLFTHLDHAVLQAVQEGRWLLINRDEENFDWADFEKTVSRKLLEARSEALMKNPPPQPRRECLVFRVVDSETAEPLLNQHCIAAFEGQQEKRKIDALGIAYLLDQTRALKLSVQLLP